MVGALWCVFFFTFLFFFSSKYSVIKQFADTQNAHTHTHTHTHRYKNHQKTQKQKGGRCCSTHAFPLSFYTQCMLGYKGYIWFSKTHKLKSIVPCMEQCWYWDGKKHQNNNNFKHTQNNKNEKKKKKHGVKEVSWRHQQLQKQLKIKLLFVDFYKANHDLWNIKPTKNKTKKTKKKHKHTIATNSKQKQNTDYRY